MKKTLYFLSMIVIFFLTSICLQTDSSAVELNSGEWKFGINGFLDFEYAYMDDMAKESAAMDVVKMEDSSTFSQNHLNLLIGAEKGKMRIQINLHSHNAYSSEEAEGREFKFEEVYGVYTINDLVNFQAGYALSPFGLYNEISYILPLFSTVVLPQMYQLPSNYESGDESVSKALIPPHNNLMFSGNHLGDSMELSYSFYATNGQEHKGHDENDDKGFGTRFKTTIQDDYNLGVSFFTVNNKDRTIGRETLIGLDLELNLLSSLLKVEMEYVADRYEIRKDRHSYYIRLTGCIEKFSPFVGYDYLHDDESALYKRGVNRYSVGTGYTLSDTVTIKGEYHFHHFNDKGDSPALPDDTENINMFQTAIIFVF